MYADRKALKGKMIECQKEKETLLAKSSYDASHVRRLEKEITLLNTKQMALKIELNSLYGAMGNQYFLYFDLRIAEAITLTGQFVNRTAENTVNKWANNLLKDDEDRVIAMDTDSVYVRMNSFIERFNPADPVKFLDAISEEQILPAINSAFDDIASTMNVRAKRMVESREVIASRALWVAKKRYIMRVLNSEGVQYSKPKIKIMGIEAIKSSTPKVCREAMKELFSLVLEATEDELQSYIRDFKKKFSGLHVDEISIPRGVSEVEKYKDYNSPNLCVTRTPMNSRASIVFNKALEDHNIAKSIPPIRGGDKIKYVFLLLPNPTKQNVIAYKDTFPKELNYLLDYIDYEKQFEKSFLQAIDIIVHTIGWNSFPTASLEDFF
jgi:DNA polymerase elongation subunit (family B)